MTMAAAHSRIVPCNTWSYGNDARGYRSDQPCAIWGVIIKPRCPLNLGQILQFAYPRICCTSCARKGTATTPRHRGDQGASRGLHRLPLSLALRGDDEEVVDEPLDPLGPLRLLGGHVLLHVRAQEVQQMFLVQQWGIWAPVRGHPDGPDGSDLLVATHGAA